VRCFAVSSQSEERSFGDGLLSATVGYCRPQGLPDESVPASAFTNQRGVGAGTSVRLLGARWVWVPPALGVQPYGCAGYAGATSTPTVWHSCSLQSFNAIICLAPVRYRWCDSEQWADLSCAHCGRCSVNGFE
jgi:hypothetical protein